MAIVFFKETNTFIQQGCIQYRNNLITVSKKILSSTTVFNIDNNNKKFS